MQLQVSFLNETHPEFASARVGAQIVAPLPHRQIVINIDSPPRSIDEELYDILSCWVVDWIQILVLRENLV